MIRSQKRIYLTSKLKCTIWHRNERHDLKAKKNNTWFKQVVRNCINEVKKGSLSYCFSYEQLEVIKEKLKGIVEIKHEYSEEDGVYYIEQVKNAWNH